MAAGNHPGSVDALPVKVLHVIPSVSDRHGGPGIAVQSFGHALRIVGEQVTLATTDDDGDFRLDVPLSSPVERAGITHYFFRRDCLPYKISLRLRHWLNAHIGEFDLVHIHALFSFSSFAAARAARKGRVPYIIRPLGALNRWGMKNRRPHLKQIWLRWIELPILRSAAAIHYTAEAERTEAIELHPDIRKIASFVIPIPVEAPAAADNTEFGRRFPQAAAKRLILFLSRLDPKKGLELLLKSFALVHESEKDLLLVIAGQGAKPYADSLRRLAQKLHISEHVLWTGQLGGDGKAAAFAAATLFVLPSHSENFGIAAAEALAAGVPNVLSNQVALAADALAAEAALVVALKTDELRSAMLRLLNDEHLRERLSANGTKLAKSLYSPESVGAALVEKYRQIVSRSKDSA